MVLRLEAEAQRAPTPHMQHWPEAWLPDGKSDYFGTVYPDETVTLQDTWWAPIIHQLFGLYFAGVSPRAST